MGLTYQQLIQMGATPGQTPASSPTQPKKGYTYDELIQMGAQPAQQPEKVGWGKQLVRDIAKPVLRMGAGLIQAGKATRKLLKGEGTTEEEMYAPVSFGKFLGEATPMRTPKEAVGAGLQLASNIPIVRGVGLIGKATLGGLAKQGFKTGVREGAVGGGLYGAGTGIEEGKGVSDVLTSTAVGALGGAVGGAVLGTALPVLGRPITRLFPKGRQAQIDNLISKREKELEKIEGQYATLRKAGEFSRNTADNRRRIASTDILADAVDDTGTIRTKGAGGAIEQYKVQTIDGAEKVVRKNLERLGETVNLTNVERDLTNAVSKSGLQGKNLLTELGNVGREIEGYRLSADEAGNIPLTLIHDAKIDTTNSINYLTPPEIKKGRKAIAKGLKEIVENNSSFNTEEVNIELSKYLDDIAYLERLDGRKVKGGKLGKYFAQISGNIVGTAAGGAIGGFPGAALGGALGGELGGRLKGSILSRTLGGKTGYVSPENKVIQEAIARGKRPLSLLEELDSYSKRLGNRNAIYSNTNTPIISDISPSITRNLENKTMTVVQHFEGAKKKINSISRLPPELAQRGEELALLGEMIKENPLNRMWKYANKREGVLPEVTGKGKSIFSRKGDDLVSQEDFNRFAEDGGISSERIREEFSKLVEQKRQYVKDLKDYKQEVKNFAKSQKDENMLNEIAQKDEEFMSKLLANTRTQSAYGGVAGIEQDEEGNIKFDAKKAALGILGMGAIKSKTGTQIGEQLFKRFKDITSTLGKKIVATGEQKPTLKLKRNVQVTTLSGEKTMIPEDEVLKAYESGGKALLKDGREYIVSKSQYENIKNNSLKSEAKEFAPELKNTEETTKLADNWLGEKDIKSVKYEEGGLKEPRWVVEFKTGQKFVAMSSDSKATAIKNATDKAIRVKGESTKYSQYQLPEGKNYKEILIKAPKAEKGTRYIVEKAENQPGDKYWVTDTMNESDTGILYDTNYEATLAGEKLNKESGAVFKSSHWDEPNVISHLRLNERTYNGKKVTFMEELQSDWAREARKKGIQETVTELPNGWQIQKGGNTGKIFEVVNESGLLETTGKTSLEAKQRALEKLNKTGVPNNPLLKNWQELSIKRALKEAVDNNSEYLAWTTGEQQAARYNLAKEIDNIGWKKFNDGKIIDIKPKDGKIIELVIDKNGKIDPSIKSSNRPDNWDNKSLSEAVGKGVADKILAEPKGDLSGEGLNIGGEWAKNLYDKQVKNIVEDITGHKVEFIKLNTGNQQAIKITPEIKAMVKGETLSLLEANHIKNKR